MKSGEAAHLGDVERPEGISRSEAKGDEWEHAADHKACSASECAPLRWGRHTAWILEIPGGDAELRSRYKHTAVGKLGVVLAPGRPPRLVVDSSVSGVTSNTHLPNRSSNPCVMDVRKCIPLSDSLEQLVALVLDVAKAHRRILIRAADRGLLCFRHRGRLYQCLTLNFGARVSCFYWARAAGLLLRLMKRLVRVRHTGLIYVDDILSLLNRTSAPLWASVIVILLLCLRVPMSWHKCALGPSAVWIGWQMDFDCFTVRLDPAKLLRLIALAKSILASLRPRLGASDWEAFVAFITFPPIPPLLGAVICGSTFFHSGLTAVSPDIWHRLCENVDAHLVLLKPVSMAALPPGSKLLRVGQTPLASRRNLIRIIPEQRRVWDGLGSVLFAVPPFCRLSDPSCEVIRMWLDLANSGADVRSLMLPPRFECLAFADACADASSVGMGGFVRLPDSRQLFFQVSLGKPQMLRLFPWLPPDCSLQSYIATWELAAQSALLLLLHQLLGEGHLPIHTVFRCDNSAFESASWKGLSMAVGLCSVLRSFFLLQERLCISVHIDHIPGISNDIANSLSRGTDPASLGFSSHERVDVDWTVLSTSQTLFLHPSAAAFSDFLAV